MSTFLTRRKFLSLFVAVFAACGLTLALTSTALASDVSWNDEVTVSAQAVDPTFGEDSQNIAVTMQFDTADLSGITAGEAEAYLQDNATIAGRHLNISTYNRDVYDVAVNAVAKQITFKIAPCKDEYDDPAFTANYSAELKIVAEDLTDIGDAMGADVETIIGTQLAIAKNGSSSSSAAVFDVTARAQARSMNHILITDVVGGVETAIFSGTGTFANGGITIHSHTFTDQETPDYAASIVSVATGIGSSYTFSDTSYPSPDPTNGQFTITHGANDCSNIKVYVYDGAYLNAHQLAVGEIWEPEW